MKSKYRIRPNVYRDMWFLEERIGRRDNICKIFYSKNKAMKELTIKKQEELELNETK